jgi:hypothetical protein
MKKFVLRGQQYPIIQEYLFRKNRWSVENIAGLEFAKILRSVCYYSYFCLQVVTGEAPDEQ